MLNNTGEYARFSYIRAMARSRRSKWLNGVGAAAVVAGAALAVGLSPAAPARAAEAAAPNKAATTVEEVFVTASRVNRTGFTAPTPTTVVSAEDLQLRAISNIADALNQSPAFLGNTTPATAGNSTNTAGANFLNLRGMGANRTLVLVNGRRFVPSTSQGILDVNLVPQALVSRVEVVTGGASAAWGSDAVSGVVNFIFDNRLEGGRADVQYGASSRSDDAQYRVSLAQGGDFGGGRGHAELALEWFKSDGILNQRDRPWGRDQWQIFNNPTATATNGQFLRIRSPFVHQSNRTEGGLIVSAGPLKNVQFGPGGTVLPFNLGSSVGSTFMIGGDGLNQGDVISLVTPSERKNLYGVVTYDVTPDVQFTGEASYGRSESKNDVTASFSLGPYTITTDNAFLPSAVKTIAQANNISQFSMGRVNSDIGYITGHTINETTRLALALDGKLGGNWKWSAYYTYGRNNRDDLSENNLVSARMTAAIDAIKDPVSGQAVCRNLATNPGCVPINLFGAGSPSAAAISYVTATQSNQQVVRQDVAAANISGEPFSTWAGPVSLAAGAEYRRESLSANVDPISAANGFIIGNPKSLSGEFNVKEAYVETVVPLLRDQVFAKSLEYNGAVRLTDYNHSGQVVSWKNGLSYQINDSIRLRATASRDIRAPNLSELFATSGLAFSTVRDPRTGAPVPSPFISATSGGNVNLDPEKADTWTAGVVLSPSFIPGLRASLDYYDIDIKGAIGTLAVQDIINRCFVNGSTDLCKLVTINSSNVITHVDNFFINLQELITRGYDAEVAYTREFAGGNLTLQGLATRVDNLITGDGVTAIDRAGQAASPGSTTGLPRWRATSTASYRRGPATVAVTGRYVGGGKVDNTFGPLDINDNRIKSRAYLDVSAQYNLYQEGGRQIQVYGAINNLFDKAPPLVGATFQAPFFTNNALYDVVGRYFTVGVRARY